MKNKNWHIGQEVMALITVSDYQNRIGIEKGKIYVIEGIQNSNCKCGGFVFDVGISARSTAHECSSCLVLRHFDGNWWFHERRFVPLDYDEKAIEELLEEPETISI